MTPARPLENMISESLRPAAAPAALWDRVWQPREAKVPSGLMTGWAQGFAFGLPVVAAFAMVFLLASHDPARQFLPEWRPGPASQTAALATLGKPGVNEIVSGLERRQALETISSQSQIGMAAMPGRKPGVRLDAAAGCSLCHTL